MIYDALLEFVQYCYEIVKKQNEVYGDLWLSVDTNDLMSILKLKARRFAAALDAGVVSKKLLADIVNYFVVLEVRKRE